MSDWLIALLLGIVEGLTEFLPVSSTGHLILVNEFASFTQEQAFIDTFNMFIQVGAIGSVLIYFWQRLWIVDKETKQLKPDTLDLWKKTLIGVIPALILGYLFDDIIESYLLKPKVVAISLIIGGVVLLFIEKRFTKFSVNQFSDLSFKTAFTIGLIQCLAMIPGVSRSASSIIGGMALGLNRVVAAEFSFFLAIPTLSAASAYFLLKNAMGFNSYQIAILGFGFAVAFVVAYLVISVFMRYIQKNDFVPFGVYRIVLGTGILVYFYFK